MDSVDHFRQSFKYFKQHNNPEVHKEVIDFEINKRESVIILSEFNDPNTDEVGCSTCKELGLICHQTWTIFSLQGLHGFYCIKNPFSVTGQRQWIHKCLKLYPEKPSVTNLDLHNKILKNENLLKENIEKLSWATFGHHHNWDTKEYNPNNYSPFPECLKTLSKHIASCLKFDLFTPEAAIVNYYHKKSSLGIHNDHSEVALDQPIISFSFGQTAIFLVGTTKKTDKPMPIFLRSGDIIVLSGESRLAYHAVPTILSESTVNCYGAEDKTDFWSSCYPYISKHRINISVRQVYDKMQNNGN